MRRLIFSLGLWVGGAAAVGAADLDKAVLTFAPHKSDAPAALQNKTLEECKTVLTEDRVERITVYMHEKQVLVNGVPSSKYDALILAANYGARDGAFETSYIHNGSKAVTLAEPIWGWCFVRLAELLSTGAPNALEKFDICTAYGDQAWLSEEERKAKQDLAKSEDDDDEKDEDGPFGFAMGLLISAHEELSGNL